HTSNMNYLLFFLLISLVNCKGCKDHCECPDLLDRLDWPERGNVSYAEGAGCFRNITCGTSYYYTFVPLNFTDSEIPRPVDSFDDHGKVLSISYEVQTGPNINIFQFFGMVCENNEWYITKYPYGIHYFSTMIDTYIGANGELDGKKTKLNHFSCEFPSK
ncbi:hypothetical protein GCK72_015804, partial [Caenorhabditis remanei]